MKKLFAYFFNRSFTPDSMWGRWRHLNRQMYLYGVGACLIAFLITWGQGYAYYRYQIIASVWQWLAIPLCVLGAFWYIARQRAGKLYEAFLKEVETRQIQQQQVTLTATKQKVIRQYHTASSWGMWKIMAVGIFGIWGVAYTHQKFGQMNQKEPVKLSLQIKNSITQKQQQLEKLRQDYCDMWTTLRHHQAKVMAFKRTMTHTQASVYEQWNSLQQGQGARYVLAQAQQQSPQEIRNNPPILQMIRGQIEIYLSLQNKAEQSAEAMMVQDDRLLTGLRDVQNRYDQYLHSAQKSVHRDQLRLSDFQTNLKKEQKIVERLVIALADNTRLREKISQALHKDCVYWLARKKHEAKIEARKKQK
jgi:hypothetical protein